MRYLIIGLGIYGSNLARDLTDMGHEVIGADIKASNVEAIKDYISTAYILDSTDESSLMALPVKNADLVIVAIGENFGASIKTVALLKKAGIKRIYARAIDELHMSILEGLKVQRILTPEQRAAHDLVNEMEFNSDVASLRVARDTFIIRFKAPALLEQMKYCDITPDSLYGLRLVAATRTVTDSNILGIQRTVEQPLDFTSDPDMRVLPGDYLVCIGTTASYKSLFRHIQ